MSKPTFVFAPGAWHTPDCFDTLRAELHARSYPTEAVAYPTVGAQSTNIGLPDDVAALRSVLEKVSDEGKEIVLVVHSYGGLVGQNAVPGLGYKQRKTEGKKGGVIMFVYLAAFVAPKGATIKNMLGGQLLPWMKVEDGYCTAQTPEVVFYHDVDAEGQKKAIAALQHSSARIFTDEVLNEPWNDMSCMYFFCEADQALPLGIQQMMAQALGPDSVTYSTVGSHSPFLSQLQETIDGLEFAAKTGQEKNI